MKARAPERPAPPVGSFRQMFALLAGPVAWTLHLLVSYPAVYPACAFGLEIVLHLVTAVTALVALAGAVVGWRIWRRGGAGDAADEDERVLRRTRFMGLTGLLTSGFFFFVVLAEGIPAVVQHPCEGRPASVVFSAPALGRAPNSDRELHDEGAGERVAVAHGSIPRPT